jgi:hypothetical protein
MAALRAAALPRAGWRNTCSSCLPLEQRVPQAGAAAWLLVLVLVELAVLAVLALLAVLSVAGVGHRASDGSRGVAGAVIGHEKAQDGGIHRLQRSDRCRDQLGFVVAGNQQGGARPGVFGGLSSQATDARQNYQLNLKG